MLPGKTIEIVIAPSLLNIFFPLLQQGVHVEVEVGCTVKQLLVDQYGIAVDYINNRITTLFLNSKAVDDSSTALVDDQAVLALSGAMPGLVGATMRSGGYYAAMRSSINFSNKQPPEAKKGAIKIKLFNLLLEELGPRFLVKGIRLSGEQFKKFLNEQPKNLRLRECKLNGQAFQGDFQKLEKVISGNEDIILKVHLED